MDGCDQEHPGTTQVVARQDFFHMSLFSIVHLFYYHSHVSHVVDISFMHLGSDWAVYDADMSITKGGDDWQQGQG